MPARRRGYLLLDTVFALALVSVVLVALAVLASRQRQAQRLMADRRAAVRLAEEAATALQAGQPPPASAADASVSWRRAETPSGIPGQAWVIVETRVRGQAAELTALAPAAAVAEAR